MRMFFGICTINGTSWSVVLSSPLQVVPQLTHALHHNICLLAVRSISRGLIATACITALGEVRLISLSQHQLHRIRHFAVAFLVHALVHQLARILISLVTQLIVRFCSLVTHLIVHFFIQVIV